MPNAIEDMKGYQYAKEFNLHSTILFPICAMLSDTGKGMLWKTFSRVGMEGIFD